MNCYSHRCGTFAVNFPMQSPCRVPCDYSYHTDLCRLNFLHITCVTTDSDLSIACPSCRSWLTLSCGPAIIFESTTRSVRLVTQFRYVNCELNDGHLRASYLAIHPRCRCNFPVWASCVYTARLTLTPSRHSSTPKILRAFIRSSLLLMSYWPALQHFALQDSNNAVRHINTSPGIIPQDLKVSHE